MNWKIKDAGFVGSYKEYTITGKGKIDNSTFFFFFFWSAVPQVWLEDHHQINGLVQDCSNSNALTMELLQSCAEPSKQ